MATADYPDFDALNLLLAAIGTPTPGSGKTLIDVVNSLASVISQLQIGTPSIAAPSLLANSGFAASLGAGAVATYGPYATTGTSYILAFTGSTGALSTTPDMSVSIVITDGAGNTVDNIAWDLPLSSSLGSNNYVLGGPLNAGNVEVEIVNQSNLSGHYTMSLTASQLPIYKHSGQAINYASVPGFTLPNTVAPAQLILGIQNSNVGAGVTDSYLFPPSSGQALITARAANTAPNVLFKLYPYYQANSFLGSSGVPLWESSPATSNATELVIPLPRCGYVFTVTNNGTSSDVCTLGMTAIPN